MSRSDHSYTAHTLYQIRRTRRQFIAQTAQTYVNVSLRLVTLRCSIVLTLRNRKLNHRYTGTPHIVISIIMGVNLFVQ